MTQTKQLPKGWKEEKLEKIGKWGSGGTPLRSHPEYYGGRIRWAIIGDLNDGILYDTKEKITERGLKESSAKLVPKNSLLVGIYGSIGKTAITGEEMATNQAIAFIIPNRDISLYYLKYFIEHSVAELFVRSHGGTQKNISQEILKSVKIPLPPLPEQQLIVSEIETQFTRLDEAVKSLKSVKEKLRVYRKAVLKKAFEGKSKKEKVGDICIINPSKIEVRNLDENLEVSFIPMAYVSEDGKIISMDKRPLREVNKGFTFFKNGDVLLAKITPCFENGKKAIAEGLTNGIGFGTTEFYVLRPQERVISKWLFYNVSREDFRALAKRSMGGAVGQQRVAKTMIENFEVPVPSISEQSLIVSHIESKFSVIDKVEEIVEASLKKAEKLRKSILKAAFEGNLVKTEA